MLLRQPQMDVGVPELATTPLELYLQREKLPKPIQSTLVLTKDQTPPIIDITPLTSRASVEASGMQTDQDEEDPEPGSDTKVDATDKKVATDLALLDLPSDEPDGEEHFTKEKEFFSSSSEAIYTPSSRTSTPSRGEKKKEKESKK